MLYQNELDTFKWSKVRILNSYGISLLFYNFFFNHILHKEKCKRLFTTQVNRQSARVIRKNSGITQLKASSSLGVREVDSCLSTGRRQHVLRVLASRTLLNDCFSWLFSGGSFGVTSCWGLGYLYFWLGTSHSTAEAVEAVYQEAINIKCHFLDTGLQFSLWLKVSVGCLCS